MTKSSLLLFVIFSSSFVFNVDATYAQQYAPLPNLIGVGPNQANNTNTNPQNIFPGLGAIG
jgi:hypothetical protein